MQTQQEQRMTPRTPATTTRRCAWCRGLLGRHALGDGSSVVCGEDCRVRLERRRGRASETWGLLRVVFS